MSDEKIKRKKISNKNYRLFLDTGQITFIRDEHITSVLDEIKHKYTKEARALIIAMYYTGARPNEVLRIRGRDITRKSNSIRVFCPSSKGGVVRVLNLPFSRPLVKELYNFATSCIPDVFMFWHFKTRNILKYTNKKGERKERMVISRRLYYWFSKWFAVLEMGKVPPYYLRHNRFSQLAEAGATDRDILQWKGSRSFDSIQPYLHFSTERSKKTGRLIK